MPTKTHQVAGEAKNAAAAVPEQAKAAAQSVPDDASRARSQPAFQRLARAGLCTRAVTLAVGASSGGSGGGATSNPGPFVGDVLRWPGGPVWAGLAGAGIAIGGATMAIWGLAHDYSKVLQTNRMSPPAFVAAQATGIAGEVARGLLVMLVSVYLLSAAVTDDPARAKSLGQALRSFDRAPGEPFLLLIAATGLACFAAYSVFEALYRDI